MYWCLSQIHFDSGGMTQNHKTRKGPPHLNASSKGQLLYGNNSQYFTQMSIHFIGRTLYYSNKKVRLVERTSHTLDVDYKDDINSCNDIFQLIF